MFLTACPFKVQLVQIARQWSFAKISKLEISWDSCTFMDASALHEKGGGGISGTLLAWDATTLVEFDLSPHGDATPS